MANPDQGPYSAGQGTSTEPSPPPVPNASSDEPSSQPSQRAADRFEIFEQVALERLQAGSDATKPASFLPLPVRVTAIAAAGIAALGVLWSVLARVPVQVNGTAAFVPRSGLSSLAAGSSGVLFFQVSGLGPSSLSAGQQQTNALLRQFWLNEASVTTSTVNNAASLERLTRAALAPVQGVPLLLPEAMAGTESFDADGARQLVSYPAATVLARIVNPLLHQELNSALLASLPTDTLQRQQEQVRLKRAEQLGQLRNLQGNQRQTIAAELEQRRDLYQRYLGLWKKGYLPSTTLIEEQSRINGLQQQLLSSDSDTLNTGINRRDQIDQAKQSAIANLENRSKLENQLIQYLARSTVFAPRGGFYILSSNNKSGTAVREGDELLSVTNQPPALPRELPVFLDGSAAQQVSEGMTVLLTPKGISRAQFGGIPGRVIEVSKLPLQGDALQGVLGSRALSGSISQQLPVAYLARVELEQAEPRFCQQALSRRCYRWSSGRLPPHPVRLATLADVQITTAYRRPVEFVMPALRRLLGLVVDNQ
ncbi:MAG: hypothetical protein VKL97_01860 [Cyanobacteriota bacterium]|nr:hypothetical protein [Cyanobacteriota bacterium]